MVDQWYASIKKLLAARCSGHKIPVTIPLSTICQFTSAPNLFEVTGERFFLIFVKSFCVLLTHNNLHLSLQYKKFLSSYSVNITPWDFKEKLWWDKAYNEQMYSGTRVLDMMG
jgi:hypothetical protein